MNRYNHRVFLADADDLLHIGAEQNLAESGMDYVLNGFKTLNELRVALRLLPQAGDGYLDVLLLGNCNLPSRRDIFTLLDEMTALTEMPIILLGMVSEGWLIHYLTKTYATVRGYLHKNDHLSECLVPAIQAVGAGKVYWSAFAHELVEESQRSGLLNHAFGPDEIQVLLALAHGSNEKEIAAAMGISNRRVYTITRRLRIMFRADTNEQLMREATNTGIC